MGRIPQESLIGLKLVGDIERGLRRYEVSWTLRAGYKRRRSCEGHVVEGRTIKVRQRYSRARKVESRE